MVAGVGDWYGGMSVGMCSGCTISVRLQFSQGVLFKTRGRLTQVDNVMPPVVFYRLHFCILGSRRCELQCPRWCVWLLPMLRIFVG